MKQDAEQAVRDILAVVTAAENGRPKSDGKNILVKAVNTLDLYLTGKNTERQNMYGLVRDAEAAEACAEGSEWMVYLSDGGYSRLVICPGEEPNKMWVTGGPHASWEDVLSKWREIYRTY